MCDDCRCCTIKVLWVSVGKHGGRHSLWFTVLGLRGRGVCFQMVHECLRYRVELLEGVFQEIVMLNIKSEQDEDDGIQRNPLPDRPDGGAKQTGK